jgi:hypothetical protein
MKMKSSATLQANKQNNSKKKNADDTANKIRNKTKRTSFGECSGMPDPLNTFHRRQMGPEIARRVSYLRSRQGAVHSSALHAMCCRLDIATIAHQQAKK